MVSDLMSHNVDVLNSWKEIACYLGRGVRTVQRWELELKLPVHRPRGKPRSAVLSIKAELDRWLSQTSNQNRNYPAPQALRYDVHANAVMLSSKIKLLLVQSKDLCERSQRLSYQVIRAVKLTAKISNDRMSRTQARNAKYITKPFSARQNSKDAESALLGR